MGLSKSTLQPWKQEFLKKSHSAISIRGSEGGCGMLLGGYSLKRHPGTSWLWCFSFEWEGQGCRVQPRASCVHGRCSTASLNSQPFSHVLKQANSLPSARCLGLMGSKTLTRNSKHQSLSEQRLCSLFYDLRGWAATQIKCKCFAECMGQFFSVNLNPRLSLKAKSSGRSNITCHLPHLMLVYFSTKAPHGFISTFASLSVLKLLECVALTCLQRIRQTLLLIIFHSKSSSLGVGGLFWPTFTGTQCPPAHL